jgi:PhoPQ-activated pathogenicity-related protein
MDGTLADSSARAHHLEGKKDWDAWYADLINDPVNTEIAQFTAYAAVLGIPVVICTGRGMEYQKPTEEWLYKNEIPYDALYMRPAMDYRDDTVIKRELLREMRLDGYDPELVFEDRDRVVKMWREEGIRCFQVAEGDF